MLGTNELSGYNESQKKSFHEKGKSASGDSENVILAEWLDKIFWGMQH